MIADGPEPPRADLPPKRKKPGSDRQTDATYRYAVAPEAYPAHVARPLSPPVRLARVKEHKSYTPPELDLTKRPSAHPTHPITTHIQWLFRLDEGGLPGHGRGCVLALALSRITYRQAVSAPPRPALPCPALLVPLLLEAGAEDVEHVSVQSRRCGCA